MNRRNRNIILISSYAISCLGFLIAFNILMSQTDVWFWKESDGLVGIPILTISLPLIIFSSYVRKVMKMPFNSFLDFYCLILNIIMLFFPEPSSKIDVRLIISISFSLISIIFLSIRISKLVIIIWKEEKKNYS